MANILLHSLIFSPDGVSTAYLMADLAQELHRLGHSVSVLTTTPHYNVVESQIAKQPLVQQAQGLYFSRLGSIPVWHIQMGERTASPSVRSLGYLGFHLRSLFWAFGRRQNFDVILTPSPPLTIGLFAWLMSHWQSAKCVYIVQEIYPDFAIHSGLIHNSLLIWLLKRLECLIYNKCDAIVTIADRFTKIVSPRCARPEKVQMIPNFVDTELYRPLPRENSFSHENGLMGYFTVLYAGNIGVAQDWAVILNAAERLRAYPIKFVVVGDGTRREWLADTVAQRRLDNVLMLDYQPRERIPEIIASCDVATITMAPHLGSDGFPSKIYTTMACEKPSIVSTELDSELAWIVGESKCGTVVPAGDNDAYVDAVLEAFQRRDSLASEGQRGRAFVEKRYSKQAVALQYDTLVRSLARGDKN